MLSFTASLSPNSTAFALFVTEKYDYKDAKGILSKVISEKIGLFLKSLKEKKQKKYQLEKLKLEEIILFQFNQ